MNSLPLENIRPLDTIQQYFRNLKPHPPEESISLRVLVQLLVAVGIVATDVAAETSLSWWTIPLSCVGAWLSWQRRYKRNIIIKFFIAIAMLVSLMYFFSNLFANLNDTRLVLAELLIHLQVFHSFDLPRRRDLGYSMVIGLILLGVAGTISETLTFAPLLIVFLAIAIPVLILDYRSRLGLDQNPSTPPQKATKHRQKRQKYSPFNLPRLSLLLAIILGVGLLIFALFPRFPGYQLQTMPVSGSAEMETQGFNELNRGIMRPGAENGQEGEGMDGEGEEGEGGTATAESLYSGFSDQFDQTQNSGELLKPKVVMRVRSQAPGFFRVLAFDRYTGKGWEVSRDEQLLTVDRPPWTYRFYLSAPYSEDYTQSVIQTYSILEDLPNLVPALYHARSLYFPTPQVALDPEGSIRAPIALTEDLTYTVVSDVPKRDRTRLGQASTNYPKRIQKYYLQLPRTLDVNKIRQQAEALMANAAKPLENNYEKALFLAQAIKQNYANIPIFQLDANEDLVEAFLFKFQGGYPDHFATTLTVMLRSLGIPARVAVGFSPGQFNPFTGFYLVQNTDAHSLTEVYFQEYGWFTFDPRPGHELIPPSVEDTDAFGVLEQFWQWVAGWLPSPVTAFLAYLWTQIIGGLVALASGLWQWISSSAIGFLSGVIGLMGVGFVGWLVGQKLIVWLTFRRLAKLPLPEQIYQKMLHHLARSGYPKHPAQTPLEYAHKVSQFFPPSLRHPVNGISQEYLQWKYGEKKPDVKQLQQYLQRLNRLLRKSQFTFWKK